jgi:hypothetical protein
VRAVVIAAGLVFATGCLGDLDPVWQLDHDRVVAVRANPPSIPVGGAAHFDALLAHKGGPTTVGTPTMAQLIQPAAGLENTLSQDGGVWTVHAPDAATLAAVRATLKLDAAAPVTVRVGLSFDVGLAEPLIATKIVTLGATADNPAMPPVTVAGAALVPATPVIVPAVGDTALAVTVPADFTVSWQTSASSLHDDNEPTAFLRLEKKDRLEGELAVVVRDAIGGVAWLVAPIKVE